MSQDKMQQLKDLISQIETASDLFNEMAHDVASEAHDYKSAARFQTEAKNLVTSVKRIRGTLTRQGILAEVA